MAENKKDELTLTPEAQAEVERIQKLADAVPNVTSFAVDMRLEPVEGQKGMHTLTFKTTLPGREALHLAEHIEYALQEFVAEVGGKGVGERIMRNTETGETQSERIGFGDAAFEEKLARKIGGNGKPN